MGKRSPKKIAFFLFFSLETHIFPVGLQRDFKEFTVENFMETNARKFKEKSNVF